MACIRETALEENGGKPAEICAFFDGRPAFLQDAEVRYAVAKMQDELQEMRLAIHEAIYRLYRMHKSENAALCKVVDSSGKACIMRLVRKK